MKTIGIKLADGSFYPILTEGAPEKKQLNLTTVKDDQTIVQVDLYRSSTESMSDAEYVDSLEIKNLVKHPNGEPDINLDISIDENNELFAELHDPETGKESQTSVVLVSRTLAERTLHDGSSDITDATVDSSDSNLNDSTDENIKNGLNDLEDLKESKDLNETLESSEEEKVEDKIEENNDNAIIENISDFDDFDDNAEKISDEEILNDLSKSEDSDFDVSNLTFDDIDIPVVGEENLDAVGENITAENVEENALNENSEDENLGEFLNDENGADEISAEENLAVENISNENESEKIDLPIEENFDDIQFDELSNESINLAIPSDEIVAEKDNLEEKNLDEFVDEGKDASEIFSEEKTESFNIEETDFATENFQLDDNENQNENEKTIVADLDLTSNDETENSLNDELANFDEHFSSKEDEENFDVDVPVEEEEFVLPDFDKNDSFNFDENFEGSQIQDSENQNAEQDFESSHATQNEQKDFEPQDNFYNDDFTANSAGLDFSDILDEETIDGNAAGNSCDDEIKKKTKIPVIICIICAIICIIAALLTLFIIPSKFNLVQKQNDSSKIETAQIEKNSTENLIEEKKANEKIEEPPAPKHEAKVDEIVVAPVEEVIPEIPAPKKEPKKVVTYKIKWGDTLWDLAKSYYNNPWKYPKIAKANGIKNPDYIISGTVITIPED